VEYQTASGVVKNLGAPIKAGDRLLLLPGDHGKVAITGMYNNAGFIVLEGASGREKAVLRGLTVTGASRWAFKNIKVLADTKALPANEADMLVKINGDTWAGPTNNILFLRNIVATTDDAKGWSATDWVKKNFGGVSNAATCAVVGQN